MKFRQTCSRIKVFVFEFVYKEQDDIYVIGVMDSFVSVSVFRIQYFIILKTKGFNILYL